MTSYFLWSIKPEHGHHPINLCTRLCSASISHCVLNWITLFGLPNFHAIIPPADRQPKSVKVKFIFTAENYLKDIRMSGKCPIDVKNTGNFDAFICGKTSKIGHVRHPSIFLIHYKLINTNLLESCTSWQNPYGSYKTHERFKRA